MLLADPERARRVRSPLVANASWVFSRFEPRPDLLRFFFALALSATLTVAQLASWSAGRPLAPYRLRDSIWVSKGQWLGLINLSGLQTRRIALTGGSTLVDAAR